MKYATPTLVAIGCASALVLGGPDGQGDNSNPEFERSMAGVALGLDD